MHPLVILLIIVLALILAAFLFWKIWFLRQPERNVPKTGIVSPASGKLVRVISFRNGKPQDVPKGMLGLVRATTKDVAADGQMLVIMLTPFDVHYQRAPSDGIVEKVVYTKGKFKNAVFGADQLHAFENEKNEILFKANGGKGSNAKDSRFKVIQVAGVAARRIVCYVKPGQKVKKGEVIGLINLGSQCILIMPKTKLKVQVGQHVIDGETVIA